MPLVTGWFVSNSNGAVKKFVNMPKGIREEKINDNE